MTVSSVDTHGYHIVKNSCALVCVCVSVMYYQVVHMSISACS